MFGPVRRYGHVRLPESFHSYSKSSMADLSHWNFAGKFTGREIAALMHGRDPEEAWKGATASSSPAWVVYRRLEAEFIRTVDAYLQARKHQDGQPIDLDSLPKARLLPSIELRAQFASPKHGLSDALLPVSVYSMKAHFDRQAFLRADVSRWLRDEGVRSAYDFTENADNRLTLEFGASEDDIDPSDMPEELQAANIAYRAVLNGYGQPGETFRNRLVAYLGERFRFSDEAVKRIATVANADKTVGRKRRED